MPYVDANLDDEWSITFHIFIRGRPNTFFPYDYVGNSGQTIFEIDSYSTNGNQRPAFAVTWQESNQHLSFSCWDCPSNYGTYSFRNMNNYYNTWIKIELREVFAPSSYYSRYDDWKSNKLIQLLENDDLKYSYSTERQSGHSYYHIYSGIVNPHIYGWNFGVPNFDSPSLISEVDIRSTRIETCDKCSAGAHNCVQNASCTDRNKAHNFEGMIDCECRPGFIGSGEYRCRDCNHRFNCMRLRSGCGGGYPVDFSKFYLESCLASFRKVLKNYQF